MRSLFFSSLNIFCMFCFIMRRAVSLKVTCSDALTTTSQMFILESCSCSQCNIDVYTRIVLLLSMQHRTPSAVEKFFTRVARVVCVALFLRVVDIGGVVRAVRPDQSISRVSSFCS